MKSYNEFFVFRKKKKEGEEEEETEVKSQMLIDYFKEDYLLSIIGNRDFTYPNCEYPGIVKPSVH